LQCGLEVRDGRKDSTFLSDDILASTAAGDLLFAYDRYFTSLFQVVQLFSLPSIEDCVNLGLHA
jgi:hypothetical protein